MTRISVISTWLCATGVAVIVSYSILTHHKNTPVEQKKAQEVAERIIRRGTIPEYKPRVKHSSAIKMTTVAKVVEKDVKEPIYVPNPLYPPFTNALNALVKEFAEIAKEGDVVLTNGFVLTLKDGKPILKFPNEYAKVGIGGMAIGDELKCGSFSVSRKRINDTDKWEMDGIAMYRSKRLDEPEFYCTNVRYSALPATGQIDAIKMHGNLEIGNTTKAYEIVEEIAQWMKDEYGAIDLDVVTPAGTLASKKFKIGDGMDAEVAVRWNRNRTGENGDAQIDVSFTTGELKEENQYQRKELGRATDAARVSTYSSTGINYFTVSPKVRAEVNESKEVFY